MGVIVNDKLKFNSQCVAASKKANKILEFISRAFDYKSKDIIIPLYKSLVRPHLEYAIQFWSPYHGKDIGLLERVQRRATKLFPNLRNRPYEERLKKLGLYTLSTRRRRGDIIEVFRIINGFDVLNSEFFTIDTHCITRNNGFKLVGKRFRTDIAKNFFANRIINDWNQLPWDVVHSQSINIFKNRLDKYFKSRNIS